MKFISTRGAAPPASFSDVLLAGLAPDGGLYLPESWPQFTAAEIAGFKALRYQDVAFQILSRFTQASFSDAELRDSITSAYADFDAPGIAPLTEIGEGRYLLELFHGPTLAFKDIALQVLGQLFSRALARRGGRATIVAATSGDTGSAAIAALGGLPNIDVFVMHPRGRVSEVQRLQMTTSAHANVHNIALEGSFDDAQSIVKSLFSDTGFADKVGLTAVNSINFARIAAQCVYYFTVTAQLGLPATFVVPTGNFGDIFAGEAASRMGLDVARLVIATNANDIMARALN
ncbi:MAG TPA: threonine synthase, partial [Rhizomicrobium sp.]|nr:threonine synthase [Rhizomicrobium sp.]